MRAVIGWLRAQYRNPDEQIKVTNDFHKTFERNGADVLEDLRRFCFVYDTAYVPGDPVRQNMNEGRREAYLHIVHMLETSPDEIKKPTKKENKDERDDERPASADD